MTVLHPALLLVGALVAAAVVAGYVALQRRRTRALAAAGLSGWTLGAPSAAASVRRGRTAALRRHAPAATVLLAVTLLLLSLSRPQAVVAVPRAAGTVVIAFDVSASMTADDVSPSRLEVAQDVASAIVEAQPDSVDVGVVTFAGSAMTTQQPAADHAEALEAIERVTAAGGTSLAAAILAALSTLTGTTVTLPADGTGTATAAGSVDSAASSTQDLGYWGSATIVLLSDGEDTSAADTLAAAALASTAGVHIETVGIGTAAGTTVEVDGYQVATALDEAALTEIAQTTGGSYHAAADAAALDVASSLDLRLVAEPQAQEITALVVGAAVLLLLVGGLATLRRTGKVL